MVLVDSYVAAMLCLPVLLILVGAGLVLQQRLALLTGSPSGPVNRAIVCTLDLLESRDMEVDHIWITMPEANNSNTFGVFASNQFAFLYGNGGYMGTQVWREGLATDSGLDFFLGSGVSHKVIFSIWDADSQHMAMPGVDEVSRKNCKRFDGEGEGSQCIIPFRLPVGEKVTVAMHYTGRTAQDGVAGDLWTGTARNPGSGESRTLGSIFVPDMVPGVGFGAIQPPRSGSAFLEYFRATGCEEQALSAVGLMGPYFEGRSVVPYQAFPRPEPGACQRMDLASCIPGHGCGRPRLLLTAGGRTLSHVGFGQGLWDVGTEGPYLQ